MIGERDAEKPHSGGIPTAGQRSAISRERWLPTAFTLQLFRILALPFAPIVASGSLSPFMLTVLLIGSQSFAIIVSNILLVLLGEGDRGTPDYTEAALAGLGVALLFCIIRPMIRLSTADPSGSDFFSTSLMGTLAGLALAQLAALGGYAYLSHYVGTSIPPVSFHHWLHAWAFATAAVGLLDIAAGRMAVGWLRDKRLAKRIVVYGGGEHGARFIINAMSHWSDRLIIPGYFDDRAKRLCGPIAGIPRLGSSEKLIDYVRREPIDEIVIALPWSADQRILEILRRFRHLPIPIRLAPDLIMFSAAELHPKMDSFYTLAIRERPLSEWDLLVKSLFDRLVGSVLLLLVLPTMGAIACLIKLDTSGPVFFHQKRFGFNNRPFNVVKFRTMTHSEVRQDVVRQAQRGDRRVTRIGRYLRRLSLDELPQLFNVLRGEMSLVGPRPHPMWAHVGEIWPDQGERPLDAVFSEYASRHRMKPGITGWAQVCGYRGETETPDKMAKRVQHDIYYIENWSLWLDIRILAKTLVAAIVDKNAY
jgi:Undecaprenyl-phosphate glucose phosphotransferase